MSSEKIILVTNDDGIRAEGLRALSEGLRPLGRVIVVAPEHEQSATSHAITLDKPLRIKEYSKDRFGVSGTPTDCILLAVHTLIDGKPDLIVSGINHGPNLGEDVMYSGTVAAAMEGHLLGIPSIAFSLTTWDPVSFDTASEIASFLSRRMLEEKGDQVYLWNVNIPAVDREDISGIRIARLGSRVYNDAIIRQVDPRGKEYFWIGGGEPGWRPDEESDFFAITEGYVSLTPLKVDITDDDSMKEINKWDLELKLR